MGNKSANVTPRRLKRGPDPYRGPTKEQLDAARKRLDFEGLSVAEFARRHGFTRPAVVYQVLSGEKKGRRGEAHRAAVLLGLKQGIVRGGGDG